MTVRRLHGVVSTLTDEHALLLGEAARRTEDVLAVATQNEWPHRELRRLLDYLHAEVMRQVVAEERLLFRYQSVPADLFRLSRDHLRLRHCIAALARAAEPHSGWTLVRLAAAMRDLLSMLERHAAVEERLLAGACAPHAVPATAVLARSVREAD